MRMMFERKSLENESSTILSDEHRFFREVEFSLKGSYKSCSNF